jgi:hypothetical protein
MFIWNISAEDSPIAIGIILVFSSALAELYQLPICFENRQNDRWSR